MSILLKIEEWKIRDSEIDVRKALERRQINVHATIIGLVNSWAEALSKETTTFVLIWLLPYTTATWLRAGRPMWYDELFTYYMAKLPDLTAVWRALADGADLNPILFHIVNRASLSAFGDSPVALRLPAIIGFAVMCVCLYRFVSVRYSSPYGLLAMTFPAVTGAYYYASEARPYGMVFGLAGIALLCWQNLIRRKLTTLSLLGLSLSLAAALLAHCYAFLLLFAFSGAEAVRAVTRRRMDWPTAFALLAPLPCVLTWLPLLRFSRTVMFQNVVFRPSQSSAADFYGDLLWPAAGALLAVIVATIWSKADHRRDPTRYTNFPEFIIGAFLAIVPIVAILSSVVLNSAFMPRYGLVSIIGVSILLATSVHRGTGGKPALPILASILVTLLFTLNFAWALIYGANDKPWQPTRMANTGDPEKLREHLPLVLSNGLMFLEREHYGPQELRKRMYYLLDTESAIHYTNSNVFERVLPAADKWFKLKGRLQDYHQFTRDHDRFLLYGPYFYPNDWLFHKLLDDGANLHLIGMFKGAYGDNALVEVTIEPPAVKER